MFRNNTNAQKCPNFSKAMFMNRDIRPDFMEGLTATTCKNISQYIGTHPMSTFIKNTFTISSFDSSSCRFGVSYTNEKSETQNRNVDVSLDVNADRHVSGELECNVSKNAMFSAGGQLAPENNEFSMVLGWCGNRFNTRAVLSASEASPSGTTFSVDVCRLRNRWTTGCYLSLSGVLGGYAAKFEPQSGLRPNPRLHGYGAALRYDGDRETVIASVDNDADLSVQYRHHVSDTITMGAMMTANVRRQTSKVTLMSRVLFGSGYEMRGEVDTVGIVVGSICKVLLPKMTVGICALFNTPTKTMQLGADLTIG